MVNPITEPFSAHYDLVHGAEVHTYADDEAVMDFELYDALRGQFGDPLVGCVGGLHYQFKPERAIPESSIAVPERNHDRPRTLLIQR